MLPGTSRSVNATFRSRCSKRGPQSPGQMERKASTMPADSNARWSSCTPANGLKDHLSAGSGTSRWINSCRRCSEIALITRSAMSPWGVEKRETLARGHVLMEKCSEQSRFAHARLAYSVEMIPPIGSANAKGYTCIAEGCSSEIADARVVEAHRPSMQASESGTRRVAPDLEAWSSVSIACDNLNIL